MRKNKITNMKLELLIFAPGCLKNKLKMVSVRRRFGLL